VNDSVIGIRALVNIVVSLTASANLYAAVYTICINGASNGCFYEEEKLVRLQTLFILCWKSGESATEIGTARKDLYPFFNWNVATICFRIVINKKQLSTVCCKNNQVYPFIKLINTLHSIP
jgi:hypothetical protein